MNLLPRLWKNKMATPRAPHPNWCHATDDAQHCNRRIIITGEPAVFSHANSKRYNAIFENQSRTKQRKEKKCYLGSTVLKTTFAVTGNTAISNDSQGCGYIRMRYPLSIEIRSLRSVSKQFANISQKSCTRGRKFCKKFAKVCIVNASPVTIVRQLTVAQFGNASCAWKNRYHSFHF